METATPEAASAERAGQERLMAAFARLSRTYELILHAASEGIFSLDLDGRISYANPAATRLLDWPMEDLLGRTASEVLRGGAAAGPCPFAAPIVIEQAHCRDVFVTRGGASVVVEYSLALIQEDDVRVGAVLVFDDITPRERAERALRDSLAALKESNERLSSTRGQLLQAEKLAAIGQLAAGVAHEINTPLGFVGTNVGIIGDHFDNLLALVAAYEASGAGAADPAVIAARRRCDLDFLREDAPALVAETGAGLATVARIVSGLRDFASAGENGEWQWAELPQLLDAARAAAASRESAAPQVRCEYEALPQIFCLAARLSQAFTSLIVNALQAVARDGRVVLRLKAGAPGEVRIEIEDDGIGIAAENLSRVRDPFFTTRPVGSGTGMGLSVADTTVRRHGGHIDIASRVGCGTRVTVNLPLRPQAA